MTGHSDVTRLGKGCRQPVRNLVSHGRFSWRGTTRSTRVMLGVIRGAHEMKRHVRLIAENPTIVAGRPGWNVKEGTGAEFVDRAAVHRSSSTAGKDQPN